MTQLNKIEKRVEALERQLQSPGKDFTVHIPVRVSLGRDEGEDLIEDLRQLASFCNREDSGRECQ